MCSCPVVKGDAAHLDSVELPPFRAAIQAGVDAVMVAHVLGPGARPRPQSRGHDLASHRHRTVARADGLPRVGHYRRARHACADGNHFPEGGPTAAGRAAVEAVKAGNDVLLLPSDLDGAYNGLLRAVRSGEIPESRIDRSVLKILRAKASVGLNKATLVDINAVNQIVAKPASLATAQEIADKAVTLVRDNHRVLPLKATSKGTKPPLNSYQPIAETRSEYCLVDFYRRQPL